MHIYTHEDTLTHTEVKFLVLEDTSVRNITTQNPLKHCTYTCTTHTQHMHITTLYTIKVHGTINTKYKTNIKHEKRVSPKTCRPIADLVAADTT